MELRQSANAILISTAMLSAQLCGRCFTAGLRRSSRVRTGYRFPYRCTPNRYDLGLSRRASLNPSDDRSVGSSCCGKGYEPVLGPKTINQAAFPWVKHLLWQREKISERPNQERTLQKIRLYVTTPGRRVQFNNSIDKFFNPHALPYLARSVNELFFKGGIIAPQAGHWEAIFLYLWGIYCDARSN